MKHLALIILAPIVIASSVRPAAADGKCVLQITRTACTGKEKESFSKCDGKASCEQKVEAKTEAECAAAALKACENTPDRQAITKSKTITALFDGKPVEKAKNFCAADRPDFNKCTR